MNEDFFAPLWGGMKAYKTYTMDRYRETPGNRTILEAVKEFSPRTDNLYIFGPTGSGKTHLGTALLRKFERGGHNYRVVWTPEDISQEVRRDQDAAGEFIKSLVEEPLLLLDDLGVEKLTEFLAVLLYRVVSGRDMTMRGGFIVTGNVGLDDLALKLGDDRITSRLAGMCRVLPLSKEPDHRLEVV